MEEMDVEYYPDVGHRGNTKNIGVTPLSITPGGDKRVIVLHECITRSYERRNL